MDAQPGGNLALYALAVGGGALALCAMPGVGGDYAGDLALIRDWAPGLVISMTTEAGMEAAGAANLGFDLQRMGCRWAHLPVPDFGGPDADIAALWPEVSGSARRTLTGGGRVLVHCRGGCGRSGMAVLRLMVETGEAPDRALARLRALRPCAVETEAQRLWAVTP
ncbi:MAG TPA: protein phosphatase [Rhodobacteraceae bacterium]|nr:protein phosphatase [Paracoccaceae bacterium]